MERRIMKILRAVGVSALLALTLVVCSNPIDLVKEVSTEVKIATNKFLLIKGVGPSANGSNVNPGLPLTITFDRDISLADIEKNITVTPSVSFKLPPSYNQATKTLSIEADPYFGMETSYTVTINEGVKGADGSDLQSGYSWSFRTGKYPTGSVTITDADKNKLTLTNNYDHPFLRIQSNNAADKFHLGRTEAECLASSNWFAPALGSTDWLVDANTLGFALGNTDGPQCVYIQFTRISDGALSTVKLDTVTMDRTPPTVEAGPQRWVNSTATRVPAASASDANGIKSYSWSGNSAVNITPNNVLLPSLSVPTASGAVDYTLTLTVVDNAGNAASDTMTLTTDVTAPNPPSVTAKTPTGLNMPTWSLVSNGGNGTYSVALLYTKEIMWKGTFSGSVFPNAKLLELLIGKGIYPLKDLVYTLSAQEYDDAGNVSNASSFDVQIVPAFPLEGSTVNASPVRLEWHTLRDGYRIFLWLDGDKPESIATTEYVPYFDLKPLKTGALYHWCIQGDTWLPSKAPEVYYSFFTAK